MSPDDVEKLLAETRGGPPEAAREALGRLLDDFRPYLLLIANQDLDRALNARMGPSDLVQKTQMEALRDFGQFTGRTEPEWRAWLGDILRNKLANVRRDNITGGVRPVGREEPGANGKADQVPDPGESPSARERERERDEAVQRALQRLPERSRQAIILRLWNKLTFAQVGEQLGCSEEAARKLFQRAAEELAPLLESLRDDA
jgi:RNA polymerase sigma-70 factor (ECF subfamily)